LARSCGRCLGTPDLVTALLERYQAAGVSHVFARLSLDDMPPEVARGTIELLCPRGDPSLRRVAITYRAWAAISSTRAPERGSTVIVGRASASIARRVRLVGNNGAIREGV
jgi:hypothetical protein